MPIGWPQTFPLDLDQLRRALAVYAEEPKAPIQAVAVRLGVGGPKVEGHNAWLKYLGLRDPRARALTPLGDLLYRADPMLSDHGTLCVLHFVLVSNPDATVWFEVLNRFLPKQQRFARDDLNLYFERGGTGQETKHLRSDIGLFLSMYTEGQEKVRRGLQSLGLLRQQDGYFEAQSVRGVHPLVFGYCLYDRLERGFREGTTSVARLLNEEGAPGLAFRMTEGELRSSLTTLESNGFVSVVRIADIDGISYGFPHPAISLLERYYEMSR